MRTLPEAFRLREIQWQVFATLSFKNRRLRRHARQNMVYAWLRELAEHRVHWRKLFYCFHFELGPSGENPHYHVVAGRLGELPAEFYRTAEARWRKWGFVWVRKFDPTRGGLEYMLKTPSGYGQDCRTSKDETENPTLSRSVMAYLRRRRIRFKRDGAPRTRNR